MCRSIWRRHITLHHFMTVLGVNSEFALHAFD
jgi:Mn-dependent DtxR family transcriptional regulator